MNGAVIRMSDKNVCKRCHCPSRCPSLEVLSRMTVDNCLTSEPRRIVFLDRILCNFGLRDDEWQGSDEEGGAVIITHGCHLTSIRKVSRPRI